MNSSANNHLGNPLVTAGITRIGKNQNRHYDSPLLNSSANNCRRRSLHSRYYSDLTTMTMTKTMTKTTTTNDGCLKRSYNNDNDNNNNNNSTTSPMHDRTSSWSMLPPYVPSENSSISMPVSADLSIPRNSFHRLGLPSQYPDDRLDQQSSNSSFESVLLEELEDFDDIFGRPSSSES